jgi:hypothetical protein
MVDLTHGIKKNFNSSKEKDREHDHTNLCILDFSLDQSMPGIIS